MNNSEEKMKWKFAPLQKSETDTPQKSKMAAIIMHY